MYSSLSANVHPKVIATKKDFEKHYYENQMEDAKTVYEKMRQEYGEENAEVKTAKRKLEF